MKTVGIIMRECVAKYREILLYGFRQDLIHYLRKYNVNVIAIPIVFENKNEFSKIKKILDMCDGIIFPGGEKVFELDGLIMKYLYDIDKPTIGICLGMQIMAWTFNGNEICTLDNLKHNSIDEYVHNIKINKESLLYKIIGEDEIKVNSRHQDYIKQTKLDCTAYSVSDNIIEAIEDKSKKCFIGIQWHPESLENDLNSKKIFDYFINSMK